MSKKIHELLQIYEKQVGNIEWHIKTNEPWGSQLDKCNIQLDILRQIVKDLKGLLIVKKTDAH